MTLLIHLGKDDNFILEPMSGGLFRLISVDNDQSFVPIVARDVKSHSRRRQVKSILFCLDHMKDPIPKEVIDRILNFDVKSELYNWINSLSSYNNEVSNKFGKNIRSVFMKSESFLLSVFTPRMITQLYDRMIKLQTLLKRHCYASTTTTTTSGGPHHSTSTKYQPLSHMDLLLMLEPGLGTAYNITFKPNSTTRSRFVEADGSLYDKSSDGHFRSSTTAEKLFQSLNIPFEASTLDLLKRNQMVSPSAALEELRAIISEVDSQIFVRAEKLHQLLELKSESHQIDFLQSFDFDSLSNTEQLVWLQVINPLNVDPTPGENVFLSELPLANCSMINDVTIKNIDLSLVTCIDISRSSIMDHGISFISKKCPVLKTLDISECKHTSLRTIVRLFTEAINFPKLSKLIHENCTACKSVNIVGPELRWISVKGCYALEVLSIKSPYILDLNFSECPKISYEQTKFILHKGSKPDDVNRTLTTWGKDTPSKLNTMLPLLVDLHGTISFFEQCFVFFFLFVLLFL